MEYRVGLLPNRATVVGDDSSWERMLGPPTRQFRSRERTFTVWSFRSGERKCMGTKRPGTLLLLLSKYPATWRRPACNPHLASITRRPEIGNRSGNNVHLSNSQCRIPEWKICMPRLILHGKFSTLPSGENVRYAGPEWVPDASDIDILFTVASMAEIELR